MFKSLFVLFYLLLSVVPASEAGVDPAVKTGIEVLRQQGFEPLKEGRVGLVTNPTGVDSRLRSTVDILFQAEEVDLVALYGPEHGIRGNRRAGSRVANTIDPETGLPVYSLYGGTRKPTPEMLAGVDLLVFDLQDIGCRSYTHISTLGLVMEAAAENGKKVVVLDRPNPMGGRLVEGTLWEEAQQSFVSQFRIPYVHGLTIGELARLLNGEKLLSGGVQCELQVVKMKGWRRDMVFTETGLPWVPTSPHIPRAETPFFYAATGIVGELSSNLVGVGYTLPFQVLAAPWLEAEKLAAAMNDLDMPGVLFRPIRFKPYYGKQKDKKLEGVQIHITSYHRLRPTLIQFQFLNHVVRNYPEHKLFAAAPEKLRMFDLVCGSVAVRKIFSGEDPDYGKFKRLWNRGVEDFKKQAGRYYLYE
ncbi:MAG: exo-beta-N-acetylmuramidase NamZ domain-containing protein [Desulfurivibrionaceae bacterium]